LVRKVKPVKHENTLVRAAIEKESQIHRVKKRKKKKRETQNRREPHNLFSLKNTKEEKGKKTGGT